jgi:hypothetical protein
MIRKMTIFVVAFQPILPSAAIEPSCLHATAACKQKAAAKSCCGFCLMIFREVLSLTIVRSTPTVSGFELFESHFTVNHAFHIGGADGQLHSV